MSASATPSHPHAPKTEAPWEPRIHVIQGVGDGPTVAVLGGVHGDEYEGILAAAALTRSIRPKALRGRLVVVPIANPPAFEAGARQSPLDERNLARTFPGSPTGTSTERIASFLTERVIRAADFLIDLHSAGRHYAMPLLCGAYAGQDDLGTRSTAAALAFGAPVLWLHSVVAPGRSLSAALDAGIPCLYAECGGGERVRRRDVAAYTAGVRRVLVHLGLLTARDMQRDQGSPAPRIRLCSAGNLDAAISARQAGLLVARVRLLDAVVTGQPLGDVLAPHDASLLETIRADCDGLVVLARRTARVQSGDGTFLIAQRDA